jgi:hypothetical protein
MRRTRVRGVPLTRNGEPLAIRVDHDRETAGGPAPALRILARWLVRGASDDKGATCGTSAGVEAGPQSLDFADETRTPVRP